MTEPAKTTILLVGMAVFVAVIVAVGMMLQQKNERDIAKICIENGGSWIDKECHAISQ